MALRNHRHPDRPHLGGGFDVHERWGSGMNNWREELIETIALQISRAQFGDWVINPTEKTREQARAALAVAEPVIREQCAKKCEGDFDSEMKGYGAYFAAAIRDSRNCVPEGGKVENQTKLD